MNLELYMMNIMPAPAAAGQTLLRTLNKQIVFPTTYLFIYHLQSLPNPLENLSSIFLIVGILRSHVFSSQINMTPPFNPSPPLVLIGFEEDQLFGL